MNKAIRVLVIDDSATVRRTLTQILQSDPAIQVIGAAPDPIAAAELLKRQVPDVITLDLEMPRMDGLTFLERLMAQHPIPVVICSSHTKSGSIAALAALEKGAVDIIEKPHADSPEHLRALGSGCISRCKGVSLRPRKSRRSSR